MQAKNHFSDTLSVCHLSSDCFYPIAVFANAEKRLTVTQLKQTLLAASAAHKSDADILRCASSRSTQANLRRFICVL
jgi:hypothetical protein